MATNSAGLTDEVVVELNGPPPPPPRNQPDRIPDRPADGAAKEKWAAYVVALGVHPDRAAGQSRQDLIDLADRLGG